MSAAAAASSSSAAAAAAAAATPEHSSELLRKASALAFRESVNYELLKVSRRLQRLQVQQDALIRWYLDHQEAGFKKWLEKHGDDDEWPGGFTVDDEEKNADERNLYELRDSNGLIGVYAKQHIKYGTTIQYPGVVMTVEMHNDFTKEFYCPTSSSFEFNGEKYILYGFPCRIGPMINNISRQQIATCSLTPSADVKLDEETNSIPSNAVYFKTETLQPNQELLCLYQKAKNGSNFFKEEGKKARSCDKCARRTTEKGSRDFVECSYVSEETGKCWFGRHVRCFAVYESSEQPFLCLDHEEHTMAKWEGGALRMLQASKKKYESQNKKNLAIVPFHAKAQLARLAKQQHWLDTAADGYDYAIWSFVEPPKWVTDHFELRESDAAPGTIGVFAKRDIKDKRCIALIEGETVDREFRIPYNGLVVSKKDAEALEKMINCPTQVPFGLTDHALFGNPADLGPNINSADNKGDQNLDPTKLDRSTLAGVNCELAHDKVDGVTTVFVQLVDSVNAGDEILLDYGATFWENINGRKKGRNGKKGKEDMSKRFCLKCQLKFRAPIKEVPAFFVSDGRKHEWKMRDCAHSPSCKFRNSIHVGCMDASQRNEERWYCDEHAKDRKPLPAAASAAASMHESDDDHDSDIEEIPKFPTKKNEKAPTEAASSSAAVVAPVDFMEDTPEFDPSDKDSDDEVPQTPVSLSPGFIPPHRSPSPAHANQQYQMQLDGLLDVDGTVLPTEAENEFADEESQGMTYASAHFARLLISKPKK